MPYDPPSASRRLAADLFPDGDYRFHLTLRRAEPGEFFAPHDASGTLLAERARWLAAEPVRYAALQPEGEPLLAEFNALRATWAGVPAARAGTMLEVGRQLEPDVLLLSADDTRHFRLRGGAVVFSTGWALEEKMGLPLESIHGIVPGLNPAIGAAIQQFLSRLKPGVAYLRDNWGVAATDELNLHPARGLAPPAAPVALNRLWLRVEHQAIVALPRTDGIVFGIRIALHRLDRIAGTSAAAGLRRGLATMPAQLAAYKRLAAVRDEIVRLL
jgi:hypothetical protein